MLFVVAAVQCDRCRFAHFRKMLPLSQASNLTPDHVRHLARSGEGYGFRVIEGVPQDLCPDCLANLRIED